MTTSSHTAQPTAIAPAVAGRRLGVVLAVILFASFMDLLDATIVVVAGPTIMQSLAASDSQLQWIIAAYTLALGSGLITGGRVGDDYGRRRVFLLSLGGFTVASALCAVAPNPEVLIAMRVVQGMAAGLMVPQVFGIIRASVPEQARAKAFGAFGAVQGIAAIAGPLLGGALIEADLVGSGWRSIFWVNVPIGVVALVLGMKVLPESTSAYRSRLDVNGALLASASVLLILCPLVQGRSWGWPWWGYAIMFAGVAMMGAFLVYEARLAASGGQPLLPPALLRVSSFSAGAVAAALFFGGIGAFFLALSVYLQAGTGRSAWETGLVLLPYALGSIVTSGAGVALAARAGRTLLIAGALLLALSQGVLWWIVDSAGDPGYWSLAVPMLIGGLGLGLTAPILVNVVLAGVPGRDAGTAGGVLSTAVQIGGAAGVAVIGTLFFAAVADSSATGARAAMTDGLTAILPWQIGLYVVTAAVMTRLPRAALAEGDRS